ncbi:hypothetical protein D3C87_1588050 [compost metagenome]
MSVEVWGASGDWTDSSSSALGRRKLRPTLPYTPKPEGRSWRTPSCQAVRWLLRSEAVPEPVITSRSSDAYWRRAPIVTYVLSVARIWPSANRPYWCWRDCHLDGSKS